MSSINFESELIDNSDIEKEMNDNFNFNSQDIPFDVEKSGNFAKSAK